MDTIKILLCDDELKERDHFSTILKDQWSGALQNKYNVDIEIESCADIIENDNGIKKGVLPLSKVKKFQIVLVDIFWKNDSKRGIEIVEMLHSECPEIPIIVLSSNIKIEDFSELIPNIFGFSSKNETQSQICFQIGKAIEKVKSTNTLLYYLRNLDPASWQYEAVNSAATNFYKQDSAYESWDKFWEPLDLIISQVKLGVLFERMRNFFKSNELFSLASKSSLRDHLEHVIYVYLTGYILLNRVEAIKMNAIKTTKKILGSRLNDEEAFECFNIAWLVCATLHDTAYPCEILPYVLKKCKQIASLFEQINFKLIPEEGDSMLKDLVLGGKHFPEFQNLKVNLDSDGCQNYISKYDLVLKHLYQENRRETSNKHKDSLLNLIKNNFSYTAENNMVLYNHGILSSMLLIDMIKEVEGHVSDNRLLAMEWAATSVALHAMRKPFSAANMRYSINLEKDPLSFLLILCDEMQIWNRERIDEVADIKNPKSVDLVKLDFNENHIDALIEYTPFDSYRDNTDCMKELKKSILKKWDKSEVDINKFIKSSPLEIKIEHRFKGKHNQEPIKTVDIKSAHN